jgi:hypothetical protein
MMISFFQTALPLGLSLVLMILPAGCSFSRPAPKFIEVSPVRIPETPEPIREMPMPLPQNAAATPQPAPPPQYHVHRLGRGETLIDIAAWYTGSWRNWERLMEANAGLDPNRLPIGTGIRIPEEILITDKPMPARVPKMEPAGRKQVPEPIGQPGPVEVELFGPIDTPPQVPMDSGLPRRLQSLD